MLQTVIVIIFQQLYTFYLLCEVLKMARLARFVGLISACGPTSLPHFHCTEASSLPRVRPADLCLFLLLAAWTADCNAAAQEIPRVPEPTCVPSIFGNCSGSTGSSGGSDSDRQVHWQTIWDRWRQHREERKQAQAQAREEAAQRARERERQQVLSSDQLQQQAATQRMLQQSSQSYQADQRARQQMLQDEARRLQKAFNQTRSDAVSSLKDDDGSAPPVSLGSGAESPTPRASTRPEWVATITDPKVQPIAHRLAAVVPPLPIPAKEVALDWRKVYLNNDRLLNTTDVVVAGWEIAGVLGGSAVWPCKLLLIGGKTLIAGENGAYVYLVEKDKDYDAALAYLKDPQQAKRFAGIVQAVREGRAAPAGASPDMVRAARAVADPELGNTGKMVWDSMTSKQALSAMVRKATIEVGLEILVPSTETALLESEAERQLIFNTLRLERTGARKMMAEASTTAAQRTQLTTVIQQSDKLASELYKVDKFNHALGGAVDAKIGNSMSEISDLIADHFVGPEAKGREY